MNKNHFLRLFFAAGILVFVSQHTHAQLTPADKKVLAKREDTLKMFSRAVVEGKTAADRFRADSNFVRGLVRALRINHSFYYPFDSVACSKLYAPDSAFRIYTWQVKKDEYTYFQRGAIQMRTPDGSLKLFPLHDVSMFTKPLDSIRTRDNWVGAIYYRIVLKTFNNKKYYTLLGFDDYSIGSNKKWMEVLTFNEAGQPVFGGPYFSFAEDSAKKAVQARFAIEYKKEAKTFFNYDPELDMIVFDKLISESDQPDLKETFVPNGDYEAFKWKNGQWVHVEKVFDFQLKDGEFPMEERLLDDDGNVNTEKLKKANDKNMQKSNPPKKNPPAKKGGNR